MIEWLIPPFLVGLLGAGHCVGMCGGIGAVISYGLPNDSRASRRSLVFMYNLGRISSYTAMGLCVGLVSGLTEQVFAPDGSLPILRMLTGVMMVLMGLYISGWWKILTVLERLGKGLWQKVQPISAKLLPIKNRRSAFALGSLWGWLPCGLVYSALVLALSFAHPVTSAMAMLLFGLGTLPVMLIVGISGDRLKQWLQKSQVRAASGLLLIAFGVWTLYFSLQHVGMDHGTGGDKPMEHHHHHHH